MPIDNDGTFETEDDTANAFLKLWDAEEPSEEEDKEGETEAERLRTRKTKPQLTRRR
jgi:hypothetical protein